MKCNDIYILESIQPGNKEPEYRISNPNPIIEHLNNENSFNYSYPIFDEIAISAFFGKSQVYKKSTEALVEAHKISSCHTEINIHFISIPQEFPHLNVDESIKKEIQRLNEKLVFGLETIQSTKKIKF